PAKQLAYDIKFKKRITSLILKDSVTSDTIFWVNGTGGLPFLGDDFPLGDSRKSGQTTSLVSLTYTSGGLGEGWEKQMTYQVVADNLVSIKQWQKYIFREMWGILLTSGMIFLFVFGLLFYSIYSLLRQRKITDLKTDFINNITHEFKTPLATLGVAVKLLWEGMRGQGEVAAEAVRIIDRQHRRLVNLTDQVMKNTLQGSELVLRLEPVAIGPYLQTVFSDFLLAAENVDVTIVHEWDGVNQQVPLDIFYFTTAVLNVLENAVKHNPHPVRLICKVNIEDHLEIRIIDDGKGIAIEHRPYVFDKFYRGGNGDTHETKGLGLGLYYTKQIVLAHGGTISLEREQGTGTQLAFTLPLH
ncbi:MAG: HAMP domain-containing sensor histidine kinase, partial [Bacteroidota bacterium]